MQLVKTYILELNKQLKEAKFLSEKIPDLRVFEYNCEATYCSNKLFEKDVDLIISGFGNYFSIYSIIGDVKIYSIDFNAYEFFYGSGFGKYTICNYSKLLNKLSDNNKKKVENHMIKAILHEINLNEKRYKYKINFSKNSYLSDSLKSYLALRE